MKVLIGMAYVLGLSATLHAGLINPAERWSYEVPLQQDLREVYGYGLCKLGDEYHLFMTAGITYKSENRKSWDMYYAIPFEQLRDKKLHGGPNPDCGRNPFFTSKLWGLYLYGKGNWHDKGMVPKTLEFGLDLITGDRQRMYYSRLDDSDYVVSSEQGWWIPEDLSERGKYHYSYYQSGFGFIGLHKELFKTTSPVLVKDDVEKEISGVGHGIFSGLMLEGKFYLIRREGDNGAPLTFSAYKINKKLHGEEVDFNPLHLTEAGPYQCFNAQSDLAICRYNLGLVFVAETPTGLGAVALPLKEGMKAESKVYYTCVPGVDTLYCDDSKGEYRDGGLPYWVGTVSEFRYDDIVKRIQKDYHEYKEPRKKDRISKGGDKE